MLYFHGFQAFNRVLDGPAKVTVSIRAGKTLELLRRHLPGYRPGVKSFVVALFATERLAIFEHNVDATGHLSREALAHLVVGPDGDLAQEGLYILAHNPFRCILRGAYLAVQESHGHHIGKTVI